MLRRRRSSPTLPLLTSDSAGSLQVHFLIPDDSTDAIDLSRDNDARPRPLVHYPDEVVEGKSPRPTHTKAESFDMLGSRTTSVAGTDDDSDDYDWSGEDDLVDEEARYEKKMGIKDQGRYRWGVRRFVSSNWCV